MMKGIAEDYTRRLCPKIADDYNKEISDNEARRFLMIRPDDIR
jgi:hypothetical protein